jgi:hypothetical protein
MNNSLHRMIDGIIEALRGDVLPHIGDPYARAQAIGIVDVLNHLRPRLDWSREPLLQEIASLCEALKEVERLFAGCMPLAPVRQPPLGASIADLATVRAELEASIATVLAWLASPPADADFDVVKAALAAIRTALQANLEREVKLTPKPLFAEIARAAKAGKDSKEP